MLLREHCRMSLLTYEIFARAKWLKSGKTTSSTIFAIILTNTRKEIPPARFWNDLSRNQEARPTTQKWRSAIRRKLRDSSSWRQPFSAPPCLRGEDWFSRFRRSAPSAPLLSSVLQGFSPCLRV